MFLYELLWEAAVCKLYESESGYDYIINACIKNEYEINIYNSTS